MTFGFVFILPVLAGFDILRKKGITRFFLIVLGITFIYLIIYMFWGFNYINSLMIASTIENPHGFRLISEPLPYLFTRLENVFEIVIFLGPFLMVLFIRGIYILKDSCPDLYILTLLGFATLLAVFLTGAYVTGETARGCLFIYPYFMFPVTAYLENINIDFREKSQLAQLVFSQSLLMQLFGNYVW
jgi:hypothetical protein